MAKRVKKPRRKGKSKPLPMPAPDAAERIAAALARLAPAVPANLETVCLKCMDRDPSRRYPRAAPVSEHRRDTRKSGKSIRAISEYFARSSLDEGAATAGVHHGGATMVARLRPMKRMSRTCPAIAEPS